MFFKTKKKTFEMCKNIILKDYYFSKKEIEATKKTLVMFFVPCFVVFGRIQET